MFYMNAYYFLKKYNSRLQYRFVPNYIPFTVGRGSALDGFLKYGRKISYLLLSGNNLKSTNQTSKNQSFLVLTKNQTIMNNNPIVCNSIILSFAVFEATKKRCWALCFNLWTKHGSRSDPNLHYIITNFSTKFKPIPIQI